MKYNHKNVERAEQQEKVLRRLASIKIEDVLITNNEIFDNWCTLNEEKRFEILKYLLSKTSNK